MEVVIPSHFQHPLVNYFYRQTPFRSVIGVASGERVYTAGLWSFLFQCGRREIIEVHLANDFTVHARSQFTGHFVHQLQVRPYSANTNHAILSHNRDLSLCILAPASQYHRDLYGLHFGNIFVVDTNYLITHMNLTQNWAVVLHLAHEDQTTPHRRINEHTQPPCRRHDIDPVLGFKRFVALLVRLRHCTRPRAARLLILAVLAIHLP
mmetsp:Transcript_29844/g.54853  ORF Transcript_29844/g.54853 Transcript_29844/m.54853 type:complete len:208 (+) Transcript_29844:302-925(+)